ncbi:hypothetical protein SAMN02745225_01116 [Ferrithrix thermotolerans DSM 19514]|uniref:Uncharacterized protein n=1 Tax=Ferrithrix thermotolerans DSM 19514 TaxID=1121881 RepID=A0A1M4UW79_9ACTN|nr:hypothetical protein SAMN02745225_01116 [Ferrithrix thermotolerans DSM 19514]
MPIHHSCLEP